MVTHNADYATRVAAAIDALIDAKMEARVAPIAVFKDDVRLRQQDLVAALRGSPVWLDDEGYCEHGKLGGVGCDTCQVPYTDKMGRS